MLRASFLSTLLVVLCATTAHTDGVLFKDHFNNGIKTDWIHDYAYACIDTSCTWEVIGGVLHGKADCPRSLNDLAVGDLSWRDYSVRVDVTPIDAINRNVAIYYRAPLDYFNVNMRADWQGDGGRMFFTYFRAGIGNVFHSVPFPTEDGATYDLEFGIVGSTMFAKVDGELVTTYDVGAFIESKLAPGSGGIALRVFSGGGCLPHEIAYDNVVVKKLRRSPLTPGLGRDQTEVSASLWTSNPVSGHAIVRYSAPEGTRASLLLYDVRGRLVRTAFENRLIGSEPREWRWDLHDNHGHPLATGVYFHRLVTDGNVIRTGRAIVVR